MTYILYTNGVLEQDGFYLSIDEENPDYQAYLAWVALGNQPESRPGSEYLAKLESDRLNRQQMRSEYSNTLTTLQQIEDTQSPTNAQVIAAVKYLAKTLRLLLKLIVKFLV